MAVFSSSRPRLAAEPSTRSLSSLFFLLQLLLISQCSSFIAVSQPQPPFTPRTTTSLYFFFASARDPTNNDDNRLPYIIERMAEQPNENIYETIAGMCINIFFKEQITGTIA
jgi:hypothetical protein